jgi:hypothetical protein
LPGAVWSIDRVCRVTPLDPDFALFVGPQRIFGRYAVRRCSLINYVVIATRSDWQEEGWMVPSTVEEMTSEFSDST